MAGLFGYRGFCFWIFPVIFLTSHLSWGQDVNLVKSVTVLGPQEDADLPGLSRDGGVSVLLHRHVVWLYDDSALIAESGELLDFTSNSAAYSPGSNYNLSRVKDFGLRIANSGPASDIQRAFIDEKWAKNGGWIPFTDQEAQFNSKDPGKERIAIWPGTNPIPLNTGKAVLFAPVVLVRSTTGKEPETYTYQGMTLTYIEASDSGPIASRVIPTLFSEDDIPYGGFAAIVGKSGEGSQGTKKRDHDIYLFGVRSTGLEVARVGVKSIENLQEYEYFQPKSCSFTRTSATPNGIPEAQPYLSGNFSSGSIFYSPWFKTFLMVYFNDQGDSTFYLRHLDLNMPSCPDSNYPAGGWRGDGVKNNDVEAVIRYSWSDPQVLFESPPGKRGYNYAGFAHPEFFNRQYYQDWMYRTGVIDPTMAWYGESVVDEQNAGGDGKHLMLSWTAQDEDSHGNGRYQVTMAIVDFESDVSDGASGLLPAGPRPTGGAAQPSRLATDGLVIAFLVVAWLAG